MRAHLANLPCPTFETTPFVEAPPTGERHVAMIFTAGLHRRSDRPFSLGSDDYRVFPGNVKANALVMSHVSTNFDRTGFQQDLNVIFPPDFQCRVLSAVLDLLNEKEGPILSEYTKEAADTGSEGPWACPIDLSWAAEDLSDEGKLIKAFKSGMNQLRNWYDITVAKRDRTTVGVSGIDLNNLANFISSFLSITAPKGAGYFHRAAFHITQNCSLVVYMLKRRHHIRIELSTGPFVNNLEDKFFFHSFAVGTIRCHGIVNIGHRKDPSQKGNLLLL
jgi:hypothetical protein